jgi:hypothetical protein
VPLTPLALVERGDPLVVLEPLLDVRAAPLEPRALLPRLEFAPLVRVDLGLVAAFELQQLCVEELRALLALLDVELVVELGLHDVRLLVVLRLGLEQQRSEQQRVGFGGRVCRGRAAGCAGGSLVRGLEGRSCVTCVEVRWHGVAIWRGVMARRGSVGHDRVEGYREVSDGVGWTTEVPGEPEYFPMGNILVNH